MKYYDIIIIGGGVIGSAVARELTRYRLSVGVLEKESDVCTQTSGRNTGMLHAGFLYKPGSLKAQCCVEGNREFDQVARELDVPFRRTGKLIVGFTEEHRERLLAMIERGRENGVAAPDAQGAGAALGGGAGGCWRSQSACAVCRRTRWGQKRPLRCGWRSWGTWRSWRSGRSRRRDRWGCLTRNQALRVGPERLGGGVRVNFLFFGLGSVIPASASSFRCSFSAHS